MNMSFLKHSVQRGMTPPLKSIPTLIGIPPHYFRPPTPSFTGLFPQHITPKPPLHHLEKYHMSC